MACARLAVGLAWVATALTALADPLGRVAEMRLAPILSYDVAEQVAVALPALGLVIGLALVAGAMSRGAAVLSAVLALAFVIGVSSSWELVRDVVVLALSVLVARVGPGRLALDSLLSRRRVPRDPEPRRTRPVRRELDDTEKETAS